MIDVFFFCFFAQRAAGSIGLAETHHLAWISRSIRTCLGFSLEIFTIWLDICTWISAFFTKLVLSEFFFSFRWLRTAL